jgi:hypothetical protein
MTCPHARVPVGRVRCFGAFEYLDSCITGGLEAGRPLGSGPADSQSAPFQFVDS